VCVLIVGLDGQPASWSLNPELSNSLAIVVVVVVLGIHQVSHFAEAVYSTGLKCLSSAAVFYSENAGSKLTYLLIVCIRLAPIVVNQPGGLPNKQNFNRQLHI
jgi:uncharacterized membrane protein